MGVDSEIFKNIFEVSDSESNLHNRVVAFTSPSPEVDVSYVVHSFARSLAAKTKKRVIIVDARAFHDLEPADSKNVLKHCTQTDTDNVLILSAAGRGARVSTEGTMRIVGWHSSPQIRDAFLKRLRENFDYVIIDCPALSASSDVKALAPNLHGVVVVVEARRRRGRRGHTSQQVVESCGGKFLGYVLN